MQQLLKSSIDDELIAVRCRYYNQANHIPRRDPLPEEETHKYNTHRILTYCASKLHTIVKWKEN